MAEKNRYSIYDSMSTEVLEDILYQDLWHDDSESEMDAILYIMKLLERRKESDPDYTPPDVKAAWKSFNENYRPTSDDDTSLYVDEEGEKENKVSPKTTQIAVLPRTKRLIRFGIVAAILGAILLISSITAYAAGYDLWGNFAHWTSETFGFNKTPDAHEDIMKDFQDALVRNGMDDFSAPHYIPDGYKQIDFSVYYLSNVCVVSSFLSNGSDSIILKYTSLVNLNRKSEYNKDDQEPKIIEMNGSRFYIMTNSGKYLAVWQYGNMEGSIAELNTEDELISLQIKSQAPNRT